MRVDIAIIGAGPAGSFTAWQLAAAGLSVVVIEEHPVIGEPRFCTGIIGAKSFARYPLPRETIQGTLNAATIHSPLGATVQIARSAPQAYIIDRSDFDRRLAERAIDEGARYWVSTRAERVEVGPDGVRIAARRAGHSAALQAQACVIATGSSQRMHGMVGLAGPAHYLDCVQAEFDARHTGDVDVFVGQSVAPGSFAWAAPVGADRVRVGLCMTGPTLTHFQRLLASPRVARRTGLQCTPVRKRRVPIAPVAHSAADRVLLVGDAAGQVKPLTGGGIYYSILCADLAARTLIGAASIGDYSAASLRGYEKCWRAEIGRDLAFGRYARRILSWSSDRQIDALVRFFARDAVQEIISCDADFDEHHRLCASLFRQRSFWAIFARQVVGPGLLSPRSAPRPRAAVSVGAPRERDQSAALGS